MAEPSDVTTWTQGDTWPPLRLQLAQDGEVVTNLAEAESILFRAKQQNGAQTFAGTAIAFAEPDAEGYNCSYTWTATDLNVPATYDLEAKVTWDTSADPDQVESWSSAQGELPTLIVRPALG